MFTKRTKIQAAIAAALLAMSLAACDVEGLEDADPLGAEQAAG